ncbi:hypothetical protein NM688_g3810 [Phlebia brevispora]|uniref:Uncharacterized protein n=1 Tax=Phlebia brevispora TaxID=194682 RepID=A0ACC1T4H0_9APHY|nr:hypothetical protein NM688_g3810 [Phlebia brevispora]
MASSPSLPVYADGSDDIGTIRLLSYDDLFFWTLFLVHPGLATIAVHLHTLRWTFFLAQPRIARNAMEPAAFELDIPWKWRFSRISYPGRGPVEWSTPRQRCEEQEYRDPMDDINYKESTAFPLLKPNIEFFGLPPPATLRRQRGWYQRRQWPPMKGKEVVRWTRAAAGTEVPQELFDNIIHHLDLWAIDSGKVYASKQQLGQIALVCRRWAKLIRPMIFKEIKLRNRDDVVTLLSFLRCPTSVISGYIDYLYLELSVTLYPYLPWVHTVCSVIHPRLARQPRLQLKIEGPLPANKIMKGVHEMLPRSYPYFSSGLRRLTLNNTQFKTFGHLVSTIGEMPTLEEVSLWKVTWDRSQDEEFRPPPAHHNAAVVLLRLLLTCPGSNRADEIDSGRLYRTTLLLSKDSWSVQCQMKERLGPDTFTMSIRLFRRWSLVHVFLTSHLDGQPRHVRAVAFEVDRKSVDVDWEEVDNLIASLPALETLLFAFSGKADALRVHRDIIAQKMAHFKDSPRLKYALRFRSYHVNRAWVQVACSDDGTITEIGPRYRGDYGFKDLI